MNNNQEILFNCVSLVTVWTEKHGLNGTNAFSYKINNESSNVKTSFTNLATDLYDLILQYKGKETIIDLICDGKKIETFNIN